MHEQAQEHGGSCLRIFNFSVSGIGCEGSSFGCFIPEKTAIGAVCTAGRGDRLPEVAVEITNISTTNRRVRCSESI